MSAIERMAELYERTKDFFQGAWRTIPYSDDYIMRGNGFQVQRRIESIAASATYKLVLDWSRLPNDYVTFVLPFDFSATGGPVVISTYRINSYTGGIIFPSNKLNVLPTNKTSVYGVIKHGIISTDTAGTDLREYELGGTGNPQQVNRSGQTGGAAPVVSPPGALLCIEIENNYSDVINFTFGVIWYELKVRLQGVPYGSTNFQSTQ